MIPLLSGRYRVIAPDLPGFGFTRVPAELHYEYTFESLAKRMLAFTERLGLKRITVENAISDCTVIIHLAHQGRTGVSVGENAVLDVNARNK